jgi:biopolymer transport protein ExbD
MSTSGLWHVRGADSQGEGRTIEFERLTRAIVDGILGEEDQVRGPTDAGWRLIGEHPQLEEHLPPQPLFRPKSGESPDMDMTPMIDVTFQLLIFFMLTAAFVVQKTLDMPAAKEESLTKRPVSMSSLQKKNVIVVLKRDGTMTVDGKPAALEGLTETLRAAAKSRDNRELVLDVEDDVEHDKVVQVLDRAADAEMQNVLFVNRTGKSGKSKAG